MKYLATFDSIEIELTEGSLGKFRSQTSDNMDRRKSRGGKSQRREEKRGEERRREEGRRSEKRKSQKKEGAAKLGRHEAATRKQKCPNG